MFVIPHSTIEAKGDTLNRLRTMRSDLFRKLCGTCMALYLWGNLQNFIELYNGYHGRNHWGSAPLQKNWTDPQVFT